MQSKSVEWGNRVLQSHFKAEGGFFPCSLWGGETPGGSWRIGDHLSFTLQPGMCILPELGPQSPGLGKGLWNWGSGRGDASIAGGGLPEH